ncbi:6-hydroxymethylpterin diphosphokinase MptE-like protein [Alteromonas macleodii]|uniref:motility associated factor glycosyltransferase family protein n=1 Tax=Alteromonas macleodii TaxID=28108 RepID=UPI003BF8F81C
MLQQIQFHVHEDEQTQQQIEHSMALEIRENYRLSMGALERFIPSLAELAKKADATVSTLLCNKYAELNIVNYNSGQVLYGMHPKAEVLTHFHKYMSAPPKLEINVSNNSSSEALVCFGLGLGYHLEHIVNEGLYKHVVVYEPNVDYFICALSSLNWKSLLQKAKDKGIALYLQIGNDGTSFSKDMQELTEKLAISGLVFFKHFHTPTFNKLEQYALSSTWSALYTLHRTKVTDEALSASYLPLWAPLKSQYDFNDKFLDNTLKDRNLDALQHYFPDLYKEFVNYSPVYWWPCASASGEVNVYHKSTGGLFSVSTKNDSKQSLNAFSKKPNKDGLLLSYTGKKLKGFLHYQLVEACEKIMEGLNEAQSELPHKIKSLILFGLNNGYGVSQLTKDHDIEMLFVCEPNKDFFYASLYAIDWASVISAFDDGKKRLYLNIGDDGSNLTNDLLVQFQTVGPYVLANTYFYQSCVNDKLTEAIARLREQLLVIIAMGDYFDNAKYGIAHTKWALEHRVPFLLSDCRQRLSAEVLDLPVFIVGNGPSLDGLITVLLEEQDNALIISCGTALQSLHSHGIKPDFHAEIETNRSTYDWLSRIDDDAYLKDITLLSCNGVHPDTASLFGHVLLAFKQGEASTVSFTELEKKHPFALLSYAYPTVTNFACNLIAEIGFTQMYLFGTDMGFVSDTYHHSKSSGYYDGNGNELYNYSDNHSMSLVIPGNFKPWVKTKYEFKISKEVLEQTFVGYGGEIYNLNNGARIAGAQPLEKELILIKSSSEAKADAVKALLTQAFSMEYNDKFASLFERRYSTSSLLEELEALKKVLNLKIVSVKDVETLVADLREFIVSSYLRKKSLAFYYLNGTFNYINSMFSKLLNASDESLVIENGNCLLRHWQNFIKDVALVIENDQFGLDNISPFVGLRRTKFFSDAKKVERVNVVHMNNDESVQTKLTELLASTHSFSRQMRINWLKSPSDQVLVAADVCNVSREFVEAHFSSPISGLLVVSKGDYRIESHPSQSNIVTLANTAVNASLSGFANAIFLQKASVHPHMNLDFFDEAVEFCKHHVCYSGPDFVVLLNRHLRDEELLLQTGDRLAYLPSVKNADFRYEIISETEQARRIKRVNEACSNYNDKY